MRNFEEWINQFKFSISGYDYYVDFKKVYDNVKNIKIELKILESLVGSENIEEISRGNEVYSYFISCKVK